MQIQTLNVKRVLKPFVIKCPEAHPNYYLSSSKMKRERSLPPPRRPLGGPESNVEILHDRFADF